MFERILINNQIRAEKVRLIDAEGKQLGIFDLGTALQKAREQGLDLVQVTHRIFPPVCKIIDAGKYFYQQAKKQKIKKIGGLKNIRLGFNISSHDLETKAKIAEKFLKEGNPVRVEMVLRQREKRLSDFAKQKLNQFLEILKKLIPFKVGRELKKEARGLTMIITKE